MRRGFSQLSQARSVFLSHVWLAHRLAKHAQHVEGERPRMSKTPAFLASEAQMYKLMLLNTDINQ